MKFTVCIKQVPDVTSPSRIEGGHLVQDSDRLVLNAYDASALEECLVMREAVGGEVEVVCVGPPSAKEAIRKALAMGADSGVHILIDAQAALDSRGYADILAAYLGTAGADLIAFGKQAQDSDAGLTGSMTAELLGSAWVSNAVAMKLDGPQGPLVVTRQGDTGQEIIAIPVPALVTCSNDMNEPRIPSLKGIMASKRKPIEEMDLEKVGLAATHGASFEPTTRILGYEVPPARPPARLLPGEPEEAVQELVALLVRESGVFQN